MQFNAAFKETQTVIEHSIELHINGKRCTDGFNDTTIIFT